MRKFKAAAFITVMLVCVFTMSVFAMAENKVVTILHTNDSHGRLVGSESIIGIDTIAQIKAELENVLLVDAGDTLHGLPFATINKGKDVVALMNMAGYDVFTPGNHDFNYGYETLLELAELADFDVISCNIFKGEELLLAPCAIKEVDGVTIGFIGVNTPDTMFMTNPLNVVGLTFEDVVECTQATVDVLLENGVDLIVVLAHLGTDDSSSVTSIELAENVTGIDIIIDGHSHSKYDEGLLVGDVLIASANQYEAFLGAVVVEFDEDNNIVEKAAGLINVEEARALVEPNEDIAAFIEEINEEQSLVYDVPVAEFFYSLSAAREPGVRTQEMPLGNLVADALRVETGADIALTNGGGLRADINEGIVTRGNIIAVLPFGNYGVTKYVTPVQLKALLENGITGAPAAVGAFPQISGFSFVYDVTLEPGERVLDIIFDGESLDLEDDETLLLLATNDFMAVGGDGYTVLGECPTENEFSALDELLLAYIYRIEEEELDVDYSEIDGRIFEAASLVEVIGLVDVIDDIIPTSGGTAVLSGPAYVRSGAGVINPIVGILEAGDTVTVIEIYKGWVKVTDGELEGWVFCKYINIA